MLKHDATTAGTAAPTRAAEPASPALVTAQQMARQTGIGSARLRTWEHRHGFPTRAAAAGRERSYLAADAPRVIAVAELLRQGTPLSEAIAALPTTRSHGAVR